jgi:hypothetical protein
MALSVDIELEGTGVTVPSAYVRVIDFAGKKTDAGYQMTYGLAIFKDATEARKAEGRRIVTPHVDRFKISDFDIASNPVEAAYKDLKARSIEGVADFTKAADV